MTFADDAGEYSIFVKNPHGEVSASASLLEEGIQRPFVSLSRDFYHLGMPNFTNASSMLTTI